MYPPEVRKEMAEAAMAQAAALMATGDPADERAADDLLRHAVHEGVWATDLIRAGWAQVAAGGTG
jgi:hypothetical protein